MRLSPDERREQIIKSGTKLAEQIGLYQFSLGDVGRDIKCAPSLVSYHFGTIADLRNTVIERACEGHIKNGPILAQAIVRRDPMVAELDNRIKRNVLETYL